jgi:hypothetical protein
MIEDIALLLYTAEVYLENTQETCDDEELRNLIKAAYARLKGEVEELQNAKEHLCTTL